LGLDENPIGNALLGNTFSGIYNTYEHFDQDPLAFGEDLALNGLGMGLPVGGRPMVKGALGMAQDALLNGFANSVTGVGSEPIELGLDNLDASPSFLSGLEGDSGLNILNLSGTGAAGSEAAGVDFAGLVGAAKLSWDFVGAVYGVLICW
jgi:hypothetical protein